MTNVYGNTAPFATYILLDHPDSEHFFISYNEMLGLANAVDVDGDNLTVSVEWPENRYPSSEFVANNCTYSEGIDFYGDRTPGLWVTIHDRGEASFDFTISDGKGGSVTRNFVIKAQEEVDAPEIVDGQGASKYIDAHNFDDYSYVSIDLEGGTGDDTITAGGWNNTVMSSLSGFAGDDAIVGGEGRDYIFGGAGNDKLTGNGSSDTFSFELAFGNDIVTDFTQGGWANGGDTLRFLNAEGVNSVQDVIDHTTYSNGNAFIDFGSAGTVTVLGVTELTADDIFVYVD